MLKRQQHIRIAAADALSAVLIIVADRNSPHKDNWYSRINEEAQRGLRIATTESIHGSLLIFRELLLHAGMVRGSRIFFSIRILTIVVVVQNDLTILSFADLIAHSLCTSYIWTLVKQYSSTETIVTGLSAGLSSR